jgi:hypothetical protein
MAVLTAALAMACLAGATAAQTGNERVGAPIQLRPRATAPAAPAEDRSPAEPLPADAAGGAPPGPAGGPGVQVAPGLTVESTAPSQRRPAPPVVRGGSNVVVNRLAPPDPGGLGTLTAATGGFDAGMWNGSRLAGIKILLPKLPMTTPSPEMQSLAERLLLTQARLPESDDGNPSLLALRVERLAAGGRLSQLDELFRAMSEEIAEPSLQAVRADVLWLSGDDRGACMVARDMVTRSDQPVWQKSAAFCHALANEPVDAQLYEQLLFDSGQEDPPFFAMLAALTGRGGTPFTSLPAPTPLHLAMLNALKWPLPVTALAEAPPLLLRGVVDSADVPLEMRLDAAERVAAVGALETPALRRIFADVSFTADEMRSVDQAIEAASVPRADALIYQLGRLGHDPVGRAHLLVRGLERARDAGNLPIIAAVNADSLREVPPQPELVDVAAEIGLAHVGSGNPKAAMAWWQLANADGSPAAQQAVSALWPAMVLAGDPARVPLDENRFETWWASPSQVPMPERAQNAALLLTLLAALGREVPPASWERVYASAGTAGGAVPSAAYVQALSRAAQDGRLGETVLLALVSLGPEGPAGAHPLVLAGVVTALRRVGLEDDARRLALEAILARRF